MIDFFSPARRPDDEDERQGAVDGSGLLAAAGDPRLAALAQAAATTFGVPIAAVSIVDRGRQYFPATIGLDATETSRAVSFCAHAVLTPGEALVVPDATADDRFSGNPLVTGGLGLRFYAGAPIVDAGGHALGALCVIDTRPRQPTPAQIATLRALAAEVTAPAERA